MWTASPTSSKGPSATSWARGRAPWAPRCSQTCSPGSLWVQRHLPVTVACRTSSNWCRLCVFYIDRCCVWSCWILLCSTSHLEPEFTNRYRRPSGSYQLVGLLKPCVRSCWWTGLCACLGPSLYADVAGDAEQGGSVAAERRSLDGAVCDGLGSAGSGRSTPPVWSPGCFGS